MKTCYIMPIGKVPKLPGMLLVRLTHETYRDIYDQYFGYSEPFCVVLADDVPPSAILKFLEESPEVSVVVHYTPDAVFLSRFSRVVKGVKHVQRPFPPKTADQVLLEECKECR